MTRQLVLVLYALAMVAAIVGMDFGFFRNRIWTWERLAANVGIVLLFGAFYFRFLRTIVGPPFHW